MKGCDGFVSVFIDAVFIVLIMLSITLCMTSSSHVSLVSYNGGGPGSGGTESCGMFSVCTSHSSLLKSMLLSSLFSLLSWMSCREWMISLASICCVSYLRFLIWQLSCVRWRFDDSWRFVIWMNLRVFVLISDYEVRVDILLTEDPFSK